MTEHLTIELQQSTLAFPIHVGVGVLKSPLFLQLCQKTAHRWIIVTDRNTSPLFGNQLHDYLREHGLNVDLIAMFPGEENKSRATKEWIEDQMLAKGFGRDSGVIALGGGIVTDVAGFVASTYCRGIPLIQVPTTLLAMVDASIGGKTAVNVAAGKNMIGTVYQPKAIFIDPLFLQELPLHELQNGFVECIKHGAILNAPYFDFLEKKYEDLLKRDPTLLQKAILDSCRIKLCVIQEDEHETGMRRLLNFGHTLGHALEILTQHRIPHGQAVAIGMIGEAYLSQQMGHLSKHDFERLEHILKCYQIPLQFPDPITPEAFQNTLKLDKKALKSAPRFVVLQEIGHCLPCEGHYCQTVEPTLLHQTLQWLCTYVKAR